MMFSYTAFLVLLTIECSIILLYLSLLVYRRKNILGQSYFWIILFLMGLISLLLGVGNLGAIFPAFGPYPAFKSVYFINNLLGHLDTTIWFLFCLMYTGRSKYLTRNIISLLLAYTILGNLAYQLSYKLHLSSGIPLLDTILSIFGYSAYLKCCILFIWGMILLILMYFHVSEKFRHQIIFLISGSSLVILFSILFESDLIPGYNPVGIHFAIAGFLYAFGMLYSDLLTFSPVFRERFFGFVEGGLIVLNERHQILDMNKTAERILHVSLDDAFGKQPSDTPSIPEKFREVLTNTDRITDQSHIQVTGEDGTRWYSITVQFDKRYIGTERVYLYVITDITRNIALEKEVSEAHAELIKEKEKKRRELMYREFFRVHRDAILILSDGLVIDCNPVALDLFGKKKEEIIGTDPSHLSALVQDRQYDVPDKLKYQISRASEGELLDFPWVFISGEKEIEAEVRLTRLRYDEHVLVEMSIRDMSRLYAEELRLRCENENLKKTLANDLYLWNLVAQTLRKNSSVANKDQYSLEEIVKMANGNLRQVSGVPGEESGLFHASPGGSRSRMR